MKNILVAIFNAHALLRPSHIAGEQYRELRTYIHERGILQKQKSDTLNRVHKVLNQMNIKVQHVISDIEGATGLQIIERIPGHPNTRDNPGWARHKTVKSLGRRIEKITGRAIQAPLHKDIEVPFGILSFLQTTDVVLRRGNRKAAQKMLPEGQPKEIGPKLTKARKNQFHFNLREYLHRIVVVDLTEIDGLDENTILTIIGVVGLDMSKWPTAGHFTSWLNLAARPKITGGKVIGHQKRFTNNPATQAFRMGAQTMWQSKGTLGHLYRRLAHTKGSKKAIKAVARRLAVIFYTLVKNQVPYDPKLVVMDEEKQKARKIARLRKEAEKIGYKLDVLVA